SASVKVLGSPVMYRLNTCQSTLSTMAPMIATSAPPRARSTFFLSPISFCFLYPRDQPGHPGILRVLFVYALHGGLEGRLVGTGDPHPGAFHLLQGLALGLGPQGPLVGHRGLGGPLQPALF